MRVNVQGTLEDLDHEYLHDLRVATRRLRSALRLFAEALGPKRCDSLRVELNWIGRLLGAVRDLDVFIGNLRAQARRLGESGTIAELLAEELGRQRVPEREALGAALASRRFRDLMCRLDALASSPPPRLPRGVQAIPVAQAAPALIGKAQKRVLKLGRSIVPDSHATDLHRLRILFKRLRYACEFFREAFADPASGTDPLADYLQAMVRFQDCLGEHQDAVVAMDRIQELVKEMIQRGALAPERLLDLGSLIQVQREIARDRHGRLAKLWIRFDRSSVRRRPAALGGEAPRSSGMVEASEAVPE
jgi:CHAD domain-containing protein